MNRFGPRALRLLADNSMVVVLLVLCTVLSIVTYREQEPDGESAGDLVADAILHSGKGQRVLILASPAQEDDAFVRQLRQRLVDGNALVVDAVQGEPRAARRVIKRLHDEGGGVDAIACSATFAKVAGLLLEDLPTDFPKLESAQVVKPESYLGPTFLKRSNLLNIANQTAVIAIVAIGMTIVIITGGIDLSVGSLIGLSAVTTTLLIEAAGGLEAAPLRLVLCSLAGIVACGLFGAGTGALITLFRVPPFIVTLAMMLVASGLALNVTGGQSVFAIPESYTWLGRGTGLFDLPNAVLLMLVLYLLAQAIMTQTTLGRYFYAVGGNAEAAR
ncbi:MAG: ABC transporter permease, partial [Planctomycetia bacterium]|nr:ABC transporter permease [Planctomycetia bacterium]